MKKFIPDYAAALTILMDVSADPVAWAGSPRRSVYDPPGERSRSPEFMRLRPTTSAVGKPPAADAA